MHTIPMTNNFHWLLYNSLCILNSLEMSETTKNMPGEAIPLTVALYFPGFYASKDLGNFFSLVIHTEIAFSIVNLGLHLELISKWWQWL